MGDKSQRSIQQLTNQVVDKTSNNSSKMKVIAILAFALFCGLARCEGETPVVDAAPVAAEPAKPIEDVPAPVEDAPAPVEDAPAPEEDETAVEEDEATPEEDEEETEDEPESEDEEENDDEEDEEEDEDEDEDEDPEDEDEESDDDEESEDEEEEEEPENEDEPEDSDIYIYNFTNGSNGKKSAAAAKPDTKKKAGDMEV